jgi:hypothetical protein
MGKVVNTMNAGKAGRVLATDIERLILQDIPAYEIRIRLGLRVANGEFTHADLIHALVDQTIAVLDAANEAGEE